jgi:hypothetical protein
MALLKYELYKIFARKSVWVGALIIGAFVILGASGFTSTMLYGDVNDFYRFFKEYEGPANAKATQFAAKGNQMLKNSQTDNTLSEVEGYRYNYLYTAIKTAQNNQIWINSLIEDSRNTMKESAVNSYDYRNAKLENDMLMQLKTPAIYFVYPWEEMTNFPNTCSFIFAVILILLGISPVFSEEYLSKMDALILSTRQGKRKLVTAKLLSTIIFCTAVSIFLLSVLSCYILACNGTMGWNAPLQASRFFSNSPYHLTILQFFLIICVIFVIGCIFFGILIFLISMLSQNVLIPVATGGAILAFPIIMQFTYTDSPAWIKALFDFSYGAILEVTGFFDKFKTYNIFGFPVLYLNLILTVYLIISALIVIMSFQIFKRRQVS